MRKLCLFLVLLICPLFVSAECNLSTDELKIAADKVKMSYEFESDYYIIIDGISEDVYVVLSNSIDDDVDTFKFEDLDENGQIKFLNGNMFRKFSYILKVYASNSECSSKVIKTLEFDPPRLNYYAKLPICRVNEEYNIEICDDFYDTGDMTYEEFETKVEEIKEEKDKTIWDRIWDFTKRYYLYVVVPVVLIGGYFIVRVIIIKRRGKDEK